MVPRPNAFCVQSYVKQLQRLMLPGANGDLVWRPCFPSRHHYGTKPRFRRPSKRTRFAVKIPQTDGSRETGQSNWPQIADIVTGTKDCGAKVSSGELVITSDERSRRPHKTALVASGVNASLSERDFRSILEFQEESEELGSDGGLDEILPLRHPETLGRTGSWALVFTSPAHAKRCQQTVSRLQILRSDRWQGRSATAINASAGWTPPRTRDGTKSYGFLATTPFYRLTLEARLYPFDAQLQDAISAHRELTRPRAVARRFPVRLCVSDPGYMSVEYIKKLLHLDGVGRGRPWAVSDSDNAIVQVGHDIASRVDHVPVHDNWRVDFLTASDAGQFVRLWHRRPLPMLDGAKEDLFLKAECLF